MSIHRQIYRCLCCGKDFLNNPAPWYPEKCDECGGIVIFLQNVELPDLLPSMAYPPKMFRKTPHKFGCNCPVRVINSGCVEEDAKETAQLKAKIGWVGCVQGHIDDHWYRVWFTDGTVFTFPESDLELASYADITHKE